MREEKSQWTVVDRLLSAARRLHRAKLCPTTWQTLPTWAANMGCPRVVVQTRLPCAGALWNKTLPSMLCPVTTTFNLLSHSHPMFCCYVLVRAGPAWTDR